MKSVIVTTEHRGVFFGKIGEASPSQTEATLEEAVMVIRFGTTEGLSQLAATGPTKNTKLSAPVPKWHLRKITSIIECSSAAVDKFASTIGSER